MNVHQPRDSSLTTLPCSFTSSSLTTPPGSFTSSSLTTPLGSFTSSSLTTPPGSSTSPSLTPPPSQRKSTTAVLETILQEIRNREKGRDCATQPWQRFGLDENGYKVLQQFLEEDDYAKHKLRYDYFPSIKQFVLRMPTAIHEILIRRVAEEIVRQLNSIAERNDASGEFARNIEDSGSTRLTFPDSDYGPHDPDGSFRHLGAKYPGVIIEVSYSQKRKDLPRLADDYILGSDGNIHAVIGLDVEYRGKAATLSIWRPRILINDDGSKELQTEQTVVNQGFRDENGEPDLDSQADLDLHLEDFAPRVTCRRYMGLQGYISIPSQSLCAYLDCAEAAQSTISQEEGENDPLEANVKKRKRATTPPEELMPEHEAKFEEEEQRASKRTMRDDSDYPGSLSESDSNSS